MTFPLVYVNCHGHSRFGGVRTTDTRASAEKESGKKTDRKNEDYRDLCDFAGAQRMSPVNRSTGVHTLRTSSCSTLHISGPLSLTPENPQTLIVYIPVYTYITIYNPTYNISLYETTKTKVVKYQVRLALKRVSVFGAGNGRAFSQKAVNCTRIKELIGV